MATPVLPPLTASQSGKITLRLCSNVLSITLLSSHHNGLVLFLLYDDYPLTLAINATMSVRNITILRMWNPHFFILHIQLRLLVTSFSRFSSQQQNRMKNLQEHLLVPIDDSISRRQQLSYAPDEYLKIQPFAFSHSHLVLFYVLVPCTAFILLIVSVWVPQVFTRMARKSLPYSASGEVDYMLVLQHEDGMRSIWVEAPVHRDIEAEAHHKLPWIWFEFKKHRYVFNYESATTSDTWRLSKRT